MTPRREPSVVELADPAAGDVVHGDTGLPLRGEGESDRRLESERIRRGPEYPGRRLGSRLDLHSRSGLLPDSRKVGPDGTGDAQERAPRVDGVAHPQELVDIACGTAPGGVRIPVDG